MDPVTLGLMGSSALSAGGSLFGGMMGASGQAQTNAQQIAANQEMQRFSQNFTAEQGDISRDFNTVAARDQRDFAAQQAERAMGFSGEQSEINRKFQADQAQTQRNFQTEMANTAWQRGVADMKRAGINPILAASLGGASVPQGAMVSGSQGTGYAGTGGAASSSGASGTAGGVGHLGNPGESLARGISSAAQVGRQLLDLKQVNQNIDESKARTDTQKSQEDMNKSTTDYNKSNVNLNNVLQDKAKQDTATSASQSRAAEAAAVSHMSDAGYRAAQTITEGHNAHSARSTARIKEAEAVNAERAGGGIIGDTIASGARSGATVLDYVGRAWRDRHINNLPVGPSHNIGPGNRGIYGERLE